jgi:biotin carboxyl carrier protein
MFQTSVNGKYQYNIREEDGHWMIGADVVKIDILKNSKGIISILHKGRSYEAIVEKVDKVAKEVCLLVNGQSYQVAISEPIDQLLKEMGLDVAAIKKAEPIKAPMPGMVLKVLVTPGQKLSKGEGILILEAMKMENVLKATGDATVKSIRVQERTAVGKGDVLIDLE